MPKFTPTSIFESKFGFIFSKLDRSTSILHFKRCIFQHRPFNSISTSLLKLCFQQRNTKHEEQTRLVESCFLSGNKNSSKTFLKCFCFSQNKFLLKTFFKKCFCLEKPCKYLKLPYFGKCHELRISSKYQQLVIILAFSQILSQRGTKGNLINSKPPLQNSCFFFRSNSKSPTQEYRNKTLQKTHIPQYRKKA